MLLKEYKFCKFYINYTYTRTGPYQYYHKSWINGLERFLKFGELETPAIVVLCSVMPIHFFWYSFIAVWVLNYSCGAFKFVEFSYKETKKNEIIFREFETACQQSSLCSLRKGIENLQCVRECISPTCYGTIYKHDELEEGEIDVRLSSFKGCFIQRTKNRTQ